MHCVPHCPPVVHLTELELCVLLTDGVVFLVCCGECAWRRTSEHVYKA